MVLKKIEYFVEGKKKTLKVELCESIWKKFRGLMFRKKSYPLFFIFNSFKKISIHSFFCKPFKAIWLDEKLNQVSFVDVKTKKLNISGSGKYLLEIPHDSWIMINHRREINRKV